MPETKFEAEAEKQDFKTKRTRRPTGELSRPHIVVVLRRGAVGDIAAGIRFQRRKLQCVRSLPTPLRKYGQAGRQLVRCGCLQSVSVAGYSKYL